MRLKSKSMRFLVAMLITMAFITQGITPLTTTAVKAAQETAIPGAALKSKTLYVGYENYTVKINNLAVNAKVSYESSYKQIASVNAKGLVKPLKAGITTITVTISQNSKKYTSKLTITVKNPYLVITNNIQEIMVGASHTFTGNAFGISGKKLFWSSANTLVGTIDKTTGEFKAISTGTTKITLSDLKTGATATLSLTVTPSDTYIPPEGSDKAVYLSGLDLSKKSGTYYTTTKEEYIETTRFVLYLDKDVEIPVNVIELINHVMDIIEETTGYQYYIDRFNGENVFSMDYEIERYFDTAKELKKVNANHDRVNIVVAHHDQLAEAYASEANGVLLSPENINLLDGGEWVMLHELLHVIWFRNGCNMERTLCEGFTTYFTTVITKEDTVLNGYYDGYEQLSNYNELIKEDTMENLFINLADGWSTYQLGFRMMCFIIETYGTKDYREMHSKISMKSEDPTTKEVADVLKSELSQDFFSAFARWYKNNYLRFNDQDLSLIGDWLIIGGNLQKYFGDDKAIEIPDTVTFIQGETFNSNQIIESVIIPGTVTGIGENVFYNCDNLKEISIPDSVTFLGTCVLEECNSLEKVQLSQGLTIIPVRAFLGCTSLKKIVIPEGVTSVDANAFTFCSALKSITLPSTLTNIGDNVFNGCSSLESIVIPKSVTSIGNQTFSDCKNLTIYVASGSYAEKYAKENKIKFSVKK